MIDYAFPLRPDQNAVISLPSDLTDKEAARIRAFLMALAVPGKPPWYRQHIDRLQRSWAILVRLVADLREQARWIV
jgi:hypothetical protein